MGFLVPLLAVFGAFALPIYIARLRHTETTKRLELEARSCGGMDSGRASEAGGCDLLRLDMVGRHQPYLAPDRPSLRPKIMITGSAAMRYLCT